MLIKVDTPLTTMDGKVMKDNDGQGNAVDATVKMCMINALLSPVQNEKGLDKVKKFDLAQRIYKTDEINLTAEEISLIKERVGDIFPPLVVGQIYELLKV